MNLRAKLVSVLAAAFLVVALPASAALFDARSVFDLQVNFTQPALCDGSVKLAGKYEVHFTQSADGQVHAVFFQRGVRECEARGTITVRKAGGEKAHTFTSLGFNSSSLSSVKQVGQKLSLEIGAPGANQIFIWFQPAPQGK